MLSDHALLPGLRPGRGAFLFSGYPEPPLGTSVAPRSSNGNGTGATAPPADATRQVSHTGTPMWAGYGRGVGTPGLVDTQPDERVTEHGLADPVARMELFEEMGDSDSAVRTAITARVKLIGSSDWSLVPADDTDEARGILEFCEQQLAPHLDDVIRYLGGAVQYGVGITEPVYAWMDSDLVPGGRAIGVRKVAHVRQRTVESFRLSMAPETKGDLVEVRQVMFTGPGGMTKPNIIPAEKLLLWTYDRRGDDYWGYPPTRSVFREWNYKRQLESLNLLHFDRYGVPMPVVSAGVDWTDKDYTRALTVIQNLRSGTATGAVFPGGTITIPSVTGQMAASALEWARWYTLAIAKCWLTQQTELGSTETGARAVGEMMYQHMEGAVQDDVEAIAAVLNEKLVRRLVAWNFGADAARDLCPVFAPSQRVRGTTVLATTIATLVNARALTWNPETDEPWLRERMEMAPLDLDWLIAEQERKAAVAAQIRGGAPAGGTDDEQDDDAPAGAQRPALRAASRATSRAALPVRGVPGAVRPGAVRRDLARDRGRAHAGRGRVRSLAAGVGASSPYDYNPRPVTREWLAWEGRIVRPHELSRDLDLETARAAAEVQEVLRAIHDDLMADVARVAEGGAAALRGAVAEIAVPDELRTRLREVLTEAARRAREIGDRSVRSEIARQKAAAGGVLLSRARPSPARQGHPSPSRRPSFWQRVRALAVPAPTEPGAPTEAEVRALLLAAEVDRAVEAEIVRRENAARAAATTAIATAGAVGVAALVEVARNTTRDRLDALSTAVTETNVAAAVNVGFGAGRDDGVRAVMQEEPDVVIGWVYSAVMDENSCDVCAELDGGEYQMDEPDDMRGTQAPNPKCLGGYGRCRCIKVFVMADESRPDSRIDRGPGFGADDVRRTAEDAARARA